jgi:hypothetical protein
MHRLLAPVVRRLTRQEAALASPQALRTADQVRRILARALHLLESGKLFESEIGSGAGSGGGQLTLEGYVERRVNELMAVSVGLAERRRRSRRTSTSASSSLWPGG